MNFLTKLRLQPFLPAVAKIFQFKKTITTENPPKMTNSGKLMTYEDVLGFEDRINTVVHLPPSSTASQESSQEIGQVIFFPGDVQGFETEMLEQPNCKVWVDWSYEKVAKILSEKFTGSHIWLVTPSKKIYKMFAVYKNFVKSESIFGIPEHSGDYGGLLHLEKLFKNVLNVAAKDCKTLENEVVQKESKIAVVAFSKGCIVLNQLLHEVAWFSQNPATQIGTLPESNDAVSTFVSRIKQLYWLDGGHSGQKDIWVRNKEVLSCLKNGLWRKDLKIFVHVTPYQIKDSIHPWKGEEEAEFIAGLTEVGVDFEETLHFDFEENNEEGEKPPDHEELLTKHFQVMKVFR